jgi:hypothetical protein
MYDPDCLTYWCDDCGADMEIEYDHSSDTVLVLVCTKRCGFSRQFSEDAGGTEHGKG